MNIQNSKKRMVAGTLSVVMLAHAFMPAAAFAAHHPVPPFPPRHHGHHHHDYYRDKWTKHDTAAVAGLAALIGLLAVANNNRRNQTPPSDPMSYAEYRENFANRLSADDQLVLNASVRMCRFWKFLLKVGRKAAAAFVSLNRLGLLDHVKTAESFYRLMTDKEYVNDIVAMKTKKVAE